MEFRQTPFPAGSGGRDPPAYAAGRQAEIADQATVAGRERLLPAPAADRARRNRALLDGLQCLERALRLHRDGRGERRWSTHSR